MSDLQIDVLAALFFIGWPVYQLLVERPYSKKDDIFYRHLAHHSMVFPKMRFVFPLAWSLLWPANGVGAYLFWHAYSAGEDTTYLVGLIFYAVSFIAQCGWYNMFFRRRMLKTSFFVTFVIIWGGAVGYFVCSILYPQIVAAICSGLLVLWLTYATLMTGAAAFIVPDHEAHGRHESLIEDEDDERNPFDVRQRESHHYHSNEAQINASAVGTSAVQRVGSSSGKSFSASGPGTGAVKLIKPGTAGH